MAISDAVENIIALTGDAYNRWVNNVPAAASNTTQVAQAAEQQATASRVEVAALAQQQKAAEIPVATTSSLKGAKVHFAENVTVVNASQGNATTPVQLAAVKISKHQQHKEERRAKKAEEHKQHKLEKAEHKSKKAEEHKQHKLEKAERKAKKAEEHRQHKLEKAAKREAENAHTSNATPKKVKICVLPLKV